MRGQTEPLIRMMMSERAHTGVTGVQNAAVLSETTASICSVWNHLCAVLVVTPGLCVIFPCKSSAVLLNAELHSADGVPVL